MKNVKIHIFLLAVFFSFLAGLLFDTKTSKPVYAQTGGNTYGSREECIGEALAEYMNTVIDAVDGKLSHAKLLSPAFNLTNTHEVELFDYMRDADAKFDKLDGFAGNTYTVSGKAAMDYYIDNGWKSKFDGYNKGTFFTEFGQFDIGTGSPTIPISQTKIDSMKAEFQRARTDGRINAVVYFVPLYNPQGVTYVSPDQEWDQFRMSDDEYKKVIAETPSLGGVNPGLSPNDPDGLGKKINELGAQWTVQIANSPGDVVSIAGAINSLRSNGVNVIIRLCTRASCGFQNPDQLAQFIQDVDSQVNGSFYITVGPNEPATENWVGEECGDEEDKGKRKEWVVEDVPCGDTSDELHSLRPYPGSPCYRDAEELTFYCGNDFIVQEAFTLPLSEAEQLFNCTDAGDGKRKCIYKIASNASVSIDPSRTELPILGNTELVPNSLNRTSLIDFEKRMTDYVSWYLNGITQRAEEKYFRGLYHDYELTTLSGPIRKLFPREIQYDIRNAEEEMVGKEDEKYGRHDQIYVCTAKKGYPTACYQKGATAKIRLTEGGSYDNINSLTFPYKPYSSTEDRVGGFTTSYDLGGSYDLPGDITVHDVVFTPAQEVELSGLNRGGVMASFPHLAETNELAWTIQTSYLPLEYVKEGEIKDETFSWTPSQFGIGAPSLAEGDSLMSNPYSYCEPEETRTNPGDKIYTPDFLNESKENVTGTIEYQAEAPCIFPAPEPVDECADACEGAIDEISCIESCPLTDPECQVVIHIPLNVQTHTPLLNDIWGRLVAGGQSVFERFFPKIGEGSPLDEIKDIPGEGKAAYVTNNLGSNIPTSGTAALAGDPTSNRLGGNAKLFFPHLGSVHDYFLKGIQLALRPRGFGEIDLTEEPLKSDVPRGQIGDCPVVTDGPCSVGNLSLYFNGDLIKATYASQVCYAETHGNPFSLNDGCLNGTTYDYSVGLFQINLLVTGANVIDPKTGEKLDCSSAFSSRDWDTRSCAISEDEDKIKLLQKCVDILQNADANIQKMVEYSRNGTYWQPWLIAKTRCGLP